MSSLALGQTPEGNAGGFEIDDCGTLFSGTGNQLTPSCTTDLTCTSMTLGDDWAQGASFHGVLDNDGLPTIDPNTGDPYRAKLQVDQNWGNQGDGADATQFAGHSNKNDNLIAESESPWTWNGTGGGPQKNDITNGYIHTRLDPITGHRWLIVASETRATNGDSHVDYEFNLAGIKICDSTGTTCAAPGAGLPPGVTEGLLIGLGPDDGRTVDKDFIVSTDFTTGGTNPAATVRIWTETAPGVFNYIPVTDLGVDTTGKIFSSTNICNVTHDTSGGAWHHFTGNGAPTSTMLALQMVEVGIDLTGLGIDVDPCAADSTMMIKTRSSQSFTAELKDFDLIGFPLEPTPQCQITGPELVCPDSITSYSVQETTGLNNVTFNWLIVGDATFCGGGTTATGSSVCVHADPVCGGSYQLIVTVTLGPCSSTCLLMVDVDDTTPPVITCPGPVTVQCYDDIPDPDTSSVAATDDCSTPVVTWEGDVSDGQTCPETITRTYRATDFCENYSECTQTIVVDDTIAPVISCPPNVTLECDQPLPPHDFAGGSATDNCTTPVVTWQGDVSDGQTCPETITRTYRATDDCGNHTDCTQLIVIDDTTKPVITCPADVTIECGNSLPAHDFSGGSATDNCGTPVVTWQGDVSDGQSCPETITRTYLATDDCGNTDTCTQHIVIVDTTPPVLSGCPSDTTVQCIEDVPLPATVTANDICDGPITPDYDQTTTGTCPTIIVRTWTATDTCGNSVSCSQTITVDDTTAPVVTCDAWDATATTDSCCEVTVNFSATVTDNCDAPVTISCEASATNASVTVPSTCNTVQNPDGSVTVTGSFKVGNVTGCPVEATILITATDECGNTDPCSKTVTYGLRACP